MADDKFAVLAEITNLAKDWPVLVGGGAVEFYSQGHFVTGDLDLCAETSRLANILEKLGFRREGMYFVRGKIFIHVLGPRFTGRSDDVTLENIGQKIRIISLEDLIIDRLNSYKWWTHSIDYEQARYLLNLYGDDLDDAYLERRSNEEDVRDKLDELQSELKRSKSKKK